MNTFVIWLFVTSVICTSGLVLVWYGVRPLPFPFLSHALLICVEQVGQNGGHGNGPPSPGGAEANPTAGQDCIKQRIRNHVTFGAERPLGGDAARGVTDWARVVQRSAWETERQRPHSVTLAARIEVAAAPLGHPRGSDCGAGAIGNLAATPVYRSGR